MAHRGTCGLISNALSVATGRSTAMYSSEALRNTLQGMFLPSSEVKCQQVNVWATNMHNRSKKRFSYLMGQHVDVDHILASCAIPGVFPPVQINGNMFVDGGAFNSAFPTDDIKDALHNPTINTISVYSPTPWLGHARCNTTSTIGTGVKSLVKAIGMSYMHNLQELDHWQIMDMLDIDHDDVPDGRFMALYNKNKYNNNVDLLEIVKPGIQPTAELWDMAVFFYAPTPGEYQVAESITLETPPHVRKPITDNMIRQGAIGAIELNDLAKSIGMGVHVQLDLSF